jgi:hypothetical protein
MGDSEAASNVIRLQGRIAENEEFRVEARNTIADIEASQVRANLSRDIADLLSKGTDADIQKVIDDAGPAITGLMTDMTEATTLFNTLSEAGDIIASKIKTINNKANQTS